MMPRFPAKPTGEPIDVKAAWRRTMERYPKTMEALRQSELRDAQGIEAGTAMTEGHGPKDESTVANGDAPD